MNKRIRELGDKAGVCPIRHAGGGEWECYLPEAEQKFAELIIKECIEVMKKQDYHGEWLGEKLKEHFGVKE